jgi:dihydrofolate reductase
VADAVTALKNEDGGDLHVVGSTQLVRTLVDHDLVDDFRLMINPLVLGGGKRLFQDDGVRRPLELVESETTSTGAILATYASSKK